MRTDYRLLCLFCLQAYFRVKRNRLARQHGTCSLIECVLIVVMCVILATFVNIPAAKHMIILKDLRTEVRIPDWYVVSLYPWCY